MKCYFDEHNKPKVDVTVVGLDAQTEIAASIDTGFDGALMMSLPKALSIGLKLADVLPVELADGSIKNEYVFAGSAILGDKKIPVDILLTNSGESLLGMALLEEHRLTIDFYLRTVTITPSSGQKNQKTGHR